MHLILSRVARRLYNRISSLSWDTVLTMTFIHFATSWGLIAFVGGEKIASGEIFWYFYATTATTVGYGDYSPTTAAGRVVATIWVMPGGIALFTTIIAKIVQQFSDCSVDPGIAPTRERIQRSRRCATKQGVCVAEVV